MVPVFERSTGITYSLMREQRFESLKKGISKRRTAHYIDALVRSLNKDLIAPQRKLFLLPNENLDGCIGRNCKVTIPQPFLNLL